MKIKQQVQPISMEYNIGKRPDKKQAYKFGLMS